MFHHCLLFAIVCVPWYLHLAIGWINFCQHGNCEMSEPLAFSLVLFFLILGWYFLYSTYTYTRHGYYKWMRVFAYGMYGWRVRNGIATNSTEGLLAISTIYISIYIWMEQFSHCVSNKRCKQCSFRVHVLSSDNVCTRGAIMEAKAKTAELNDVTHTHHTYHWITTSTPYIVHTYVLCINFDAHKR